MMMFWLLVSIILIIAIILMLIRFNDTYADHQQWRRLRATQPTNPATYDPTMVDGLPEPARRFFNFAISPGTPLLTVAEIDMGGQFSLGSLEKPNYQTMEARQILAAPTGFVWQLRLPNWVSGSDFGSDSSSWTRFRIFGFVPVARLGGDTNHRRAAFGRYVAEAVFWTPAALLPGSGVVWDMIDGNSARVTVSRGALSQSVDVYVNASGQPVVVQFMRWNNANPEKIYGYQPFGGYLSDFREVQGFTIPFRVEAGNQFGTDTYFPFFRAQLKAVNFPANTRQSP